MAVFAKTFSKPFASDIYKYEILVRDSDHRVVQKRLCKPLNLVKIKLDRRFLKRLKKECQNYGNSLKSMASFVKALTAETIQEVLENELDNELGEIFRKAFHKEYYQGCKLTLFLLMSIIYNHQPLVLVNEFWVE